MIFKVESEFSNLANIRLIVESFTFNNLADAIIQSDVQMRRIIEAIRPSREQQYTSAKVMGTLHFATWNSSSKEERGNCNARSYVQPD